MFSLNFLDIYINLVKYFQRVSLDVSINWRYLHQDAGKTYSKISNMRSCRHMKKIIGDLSGYERIIREDHQNCLLDKREISYNKPKTCEKRFCKKKE